MDTMTSIQILNEAASSLHSGNTLEKGMHREGKSWGVIVNKLDYDIVVSEFEFQLHYYVHFWTKTLGKGMNPFISS